MHTLRNLIAAATILVLATPASAANFEVQMLNKGTSGSMVFEPALTKVAVGAGSKTMPVSYTHLTLPTIYSV